MKHFSFSALAFAAALHSSNAFIASQRRAAFRELHMTSSSEQVEALLATAAKARQDAEKLRQELGMSTSPSAVAAPVSTKKSSTELLSLLPDLIQRNDWTSIAKYSSQFGSANLKTFAVSLSMLEQRTQLTASALGILSGDDDVNLDDFKYASVGVLAFSCVSGVAALAFLPPNVGATVCYIVALLPVLFLALGSTAPGIIAGAIKRIKNDSNDSNAVSASERALRHEAAHFCCGYWCGLPIRSYNVASNELAQVEFAVNDSEYSATTVAALAVTGLAGLVGEAMAYGNAKGAAQDLMTLDSVFRSAKEFYGAQQQQDLTRWAALTASLMLQKNQSKYDKVYEAFQREASLAECVAILES
ncbi:hypothetical protein MPSEU_000260200 [Mayamaea pseudoterrestris]|nr:hypothetical protein MPSEU_000260200 [Mayamaea pseudoterrestris]